MSLLDNMDTNTIIRNSEKAINNSAIGYQRRYTKELFLEPVDMPIYLSDVYVEPNVSENVNKNDGKNHNGLESSLHRGLPKKKYENAIQFIRQFIAKLSKNVLFIEGKAGVGKSSLIARIATEFCNSNVYYVSLKEFLKCDSVRLCHSIFSLYSLPYDSTDLIFFLDGLDEIYDRIDLMELSDDFQRLIDMGCHIICTVRPGYVEYNQLMVDYKKVVLEPFEPFQRDQWIDKYKAKKEDLDEEVVKNLKQSNSYSSIISIPIMLYIIANKNINLKIVKCVPQLYEAAFANLKYDKAAITKVNFERHYHTAQNIAFYMESNYLLKVSKSEIELEIEQSIDESFYSSVYMETVIEGEQFLEFVHKSIQEFFAAKYIISAFLNNDYSNLFQICGKRKFSEEIVYIIQYFLNDDAEGILCDKICNYIEAGFPFWNTKGISHKKYEDTMKITFRNIHVLLNLSERRMPYLKLMEDAVQSYFLIAPQVTDIYKSTTYPTLKNLNFVNGDFSDVNIKNIQFYNTIFENNSYNNCVFEDCSFFQCSFSFTSVMDNIEFVRCHFVMTLFEDTTMLTLKSVKLKNCNFTFYAGRKEDDVNATKSLLSRCNLDKQSDDNLKKLG